MNEETEKVNESESEIMKILLFKVKEKMNKGN